MLNYIKRENILADTYMFNKALNRHNVADK